MSKPLILTLAHSRIARLFPYFDYGRQTVRAMRTERKESILNVIHVMLDMACLQFGGACCAVSNGKARPLTVPEIARLAEMPLRKTERCLRDLKKLGFTEAGKQKRGLLDRGMVSFTVTSVMRLFTAKFWQALGLWSMFQDSMKYSKNKAKQLLQLIVPKYRVTTVRVKKEAVPKFEYSDKSITGCPLFNQIKCNVPCSAFKRCVALKLSRN